MTKKRLRIFAGPNGSGKSSLYSYLISQSYFNQYFYINADEIAVKLKSGYSVLNWPITINKNQFLHFLENSSFLKVKNFSEILDISMVSECLDVDDNQFVLNKDISRDAVEILATIIADFLRELMLNASSSFSFETVMSHPSKIDFMKKARENGFIVYLYFISTKDPIVNLGRVANRVKNGGHDVDEEKTITRYKRTMDNLFSAIQNSDKAFIFDNSESDENKAFLNFANYDRIKGKIDVLSDTYPSWFEDYVINKITTKQN